MHSFKTRLAPILTALLVVGYCIWPYTTGSSAKNNARETLPTISEKRLRPKPPPATSRDPFSLSAAGIAKPSAGAAPKAAPPARSGPPSSASPPPAAKGAAPEGYALGGTVLRSDHRAAIINGRVYRAGERLLDSLGNPSAWTVASIERDQVLLEGSSAKGLVKLGFVKATGSQGFASKSVAGAAAPAQQSPGGPTAENLAKAPFSPQDHAAALREIVGLPPSLPEEIARASGGDVGTTAFNLLKLVLDPNARKPLASLAPGESGNAAGAR